MGTPTDYFVDPSIAGNSGAGTVGDPYGDLQYALDSITADATNGDQINIKAGTDEILAATLDFTSFGTGMGFEQPLIFRGYTSAANDGGIGGIDGNAGNFSVISNSGLDGIHFVDMHLHNTGNATILNLGFYNTLFNCELDNTTGSGFIDAGGVGSNVINCHFHNIAGDGIQFDGVGSIVAGSYFANGTNDFTAAIRLSTTATNAIGNIISISGASVGISLDGAVAMGKVWQNSILSSSGTGKGINQISSEASCSYIGNIVEGFSGAGGVAYDLNSTTRYQFFALNNAEYNNTTGFDIQGEFIETDDNETLGSSGFAKSGSDTFANRLIYFAPLEVGNVWNGNTWGNFDKGAVQHSAAGGGGPLVGGRLAT